MWPVELNSVHGTAYEYIQHANIQTKPTLRAVTSLLKTRHVAYNLKWRSWLWQCRYCDEWARGMRPALRFFVDVEAGKMSLMQLGCYNAWWDMSRTTVIKYAQHAKIDVLDKATLFDALWGTDKGTFKQPDAPTLQRVHKRVVKGVSDDHTSAALLDMDDCTDLLDKTDLDAMKRRQVTLEQSRHCHDTFTLHYKEKAKVVFPVPKAKPAAKPKAKAKAKAAAEPPAPPGPPAFVFDEDQIVAKRQVPPGSSIWQARVKGGWMGHTPPNPRISSMFTAFPSQGHALQNCLQRLWLQHLEKEGKDATFCPIVGLF